MIDDAYETRYWNSIHIERNGKPYLSGGEVRSVKDPLTSELDLDLRLSLLTLPYYFVNDSNSNRVE